MIRGPSSFEQIAPYKRSLRNGGSAVALHHRSEQPSLAPEVLTVDIPRRNRLQRLFDLYLRRNQPVRQPGNYEVHAVGDAIRLIAQTTDQCNITSASLKEGFYSSFRNFLFLAMPANIFLFPHSEYIQGLVLCSFPNPLFLLASHSGDSHAELLIHLFHV